MTERLSEHFTLAELLHSETAIARGIPNRADPTIVEKLRALCVNVLEPVRAHYGRPVRVNSGYRSPALNRAVRGSSSSQHCRGEAVDFEVPGVPNGDVALFVRASIPFDQLILEAYQPALPSSGWVHVSWRPTRRRGSVLTYIPGRGYLQGLVI